MHFNQVALILLSVFLNTAAQIILKAGMLKIGYFSFIPGNLLPIITNIALSPWILSGIACYTLSMLIWLMVLSRTAVSIAYPMISLGYIINVLAAHYFLGEDLNSVKFFGIIAILIGVFLIAKS